jgi:hypothetical protein
VVLDTADRVAAFRRRIGVFARPRARDVRIPEAILAAGAQDRRIVGLLDDCGCAPASLALVAAIALVAVYGGLDWRGAPWSSAGIVALIGFGAAVVTKGLALTVSWLRLRSILFRIEERLRRLESG